MKEQDILTQSAKEESEEEKKRIRIKRERGETEE